MASNTKFITRSGITPNEKELPYSITTSQVEKYLQDKIDVVLNRVAKQNGTEKENIEVRVYTTEAGKSFLPFVVILPMEVLENKHQKRKKNVPSIFNTTESDGSANMRPELYKLFSSFTYNKDDEQAFFSDDWRRARHVNRETSPVLKGLRTPKVTSMDNRRLQVVSFMIDPLRVFHNMLEIEGDTRTFKVDVEGWQKIQTGEYRYDVSRVINKGKNRKYKDTLADELNRKMRAGR